MGRYRFLSQALRQIMRDAFRQASGVHENQRRAMLPGEFSDAVVNFVPHLVGRDWTQLAARNFDRQIELPLVPDIDDHRRRTPVASQEVCNLFDRPLRSREPDAYRWPMCQGMQTFQ